MEKSIDHLSAESAAAVLRNLTLEKCASLRLDSENHHSTSSTAEANCGASGDSFKGTCSLASSARCSPAVNTLATTPQPGLKLTPAATSPPPLKPNNSFKSDSDGGGGSKQHPDSSLLIPSLTPFLPIRDDAVTTPNFQLKLDPIAASGTSVTNRKMARRRSILNRARVPPFPVPGTSFLGREGTRMLAPRLARNNSDSSRATTDFKTEMSLATKAKLSIPKFEHLKNGRDDQSNKKARLSPSIKLAPRIKRFPIGGTNSAATRWPQDPEYRGENNVDLEYLLKSNEKTQAYGSGNGNVMTTPTSMRSYINPYIHFFPLKTPTNHKKRSHENAPVKCRSNPESGTSLGDVFDHQLNLLTMKPKDRHFLQEKGNLHASPYVIPSHITERCEHNPIISSYHHPYKAQGKENAESFGAMNEEGEEQLLTPTPQNLFFGTRSQLKSDRDAAVSENTCSTACEEFRDDGSPFVLNRGSLKN